MICPQVASVASAVESRLAEQSIEVSTGRFFYRYCRVYVFYRGNSSGREPVRARSLVQQWYSKLRFFAICCSRSSACLVRSPILILDQCYFSSLLQRYPSPLSPHQRCAFKGWFNGGFRAKRVAQLLPGCAGSPTMTFQDLSGACVRY